MSWYLFPCKTYVTVEDTEAAKAVCGLDGTSSGFFWELNITMNDLILSFSLELSPACPSDTRSYLPGPCQWVGRREEGEQITLLRQLGHSPSLRRLRSGSSPRTELGRPLQLGWPGDYGKGWLSSHCQLQPELLKDADSGIATGLGWWVWLLGDSRLILENSQSRRSGVLGAPGY
jgi:hypothetical protein